MSEMKNEGFLIVKASTASGAIPVEGVTVVVSGIDEGNSDLLFSLITNESGLTKRISLPAPPSTLSSSPNPSATPYSRYNIDVYKDGYYPQHYTGVPIFSGITAVQNARIVPIAQFDGRDPLYTPSQIFEEYENPNL